MKILLAAIGKRVQLIKHLRNTNYVVGTDANDLAPAKFFVDAFYKVPRYNCEDYIDCIIDICKREKIDMLIPLFEKEFLLFCDNRHRFLEIGVILLLSSKKIIEICNDKLKTYNFFIHYGINTPLTYTTEKVKEELSKNRISYPLIIKPIDGMGSKKVFLARNKREMEFFIEYVDKPIIQEFVSGVEYTVDVLCDLEGHPISIVPRERIEVRAGEVSKSRSVKHEGIIQETLKLCNSFKKIEKGLKAIGPLTIQCIVTHDNKIKFIEINPRFGGGVPLTFESKVDYGRYLNLMKDGELIKPAIGKFNEVTMLRYDDAVFIE